MELRACGSLQAIASQGSVCELGCGSVDENGGDGR